MTDETSAQEAAVDAMRHHHFDTDEDYPGAGKWCACGFSVGWVGSVHAGARRDHIARMILEALTSPTKKPCGVCGEGAGRVRGPADDAIEKATGWPYSLTYKCPNPDCTDGFVLGPAPIEGLLEQVGWAQRADDTRKLHAADDPARHFGWILTDHRNASGHAVPVFRLPSKVSDE